MVKGSDFEIDKEKCIGCGTCFTTELFHPDKQGKAKPIADAETEEYTASEVVEICPQEAISEKS